MDNNVVIQPPQSPQPLKKKLLVPLLIGLFLIAIVLSVLVLQKRSSLPPAASTSNVENEVVDAPPVQTGVAEGVFSLSTDSPTTSVGTPITISVKADSNGRGVVGFDAVLQYDITAFTLGEVKSAVAGFTAISSSRKNYLEVTSFKDVASTVPPIFKDTEVLTFTLTPLKAGNFTIELLDKADSSNTKYIDSTTEVYIPQVSGVSVDVK